MVRRDPTETGGTYYRIAARRPLENYDGFTLRVKKPTQGLDLNRNFPASWRQEFEQLGAGPYPTSEPEVRAVVDFIVRHPNITGGIDVPHVERRAAAAVRAPARRRDARRRPVGLPGGRAARAPSSPAIRRSPSIHEFRYHPKSVIGGTFDWIYEHLGMFTLGRRDLERRCARPASPNYKFIDWFRDHPIEDDLKLYPLERRQARAASRTSPWKPFDHPQLGKRRDRRLEPLPRVRQSAAAAARARARALPEVAALAGADLAEARARARRREALGDDTWKVTLVVQNTGWLPTYVSKRALERKIGARRRSPRSRCPTARRSCTASARRARPARRQGVQAHRRVVLARLQRHRRPREGRVGRARRGGRRRSRSSRGTSAPARCARRRADERQHDAAWRAAHDDDSSRSEHDACTDRRSARCNGRTLALRRRLRDAAAAAAPALDRIEHIVVIYAENRSFDNLYGLFPGANGIANATPAQYTQVDRDGKPLPKLPPVWKGKDADPGVSAGPAEPAVPHRRAAGQPAAVDAHARPRSTSSTATRSRSTAGATTASSRRPTPAR